MTNSDHDKGMALVERVQTAIRSSDVNQEFVKRTLLAELGKELYNAGQPLNGLIKLMIGDDNPAN
jgi:hypothetical protein